MRESESAIDPPARPMPPIVGIVLGLLAAAALGFALFSGQWLYADSTQLQYVHDNGYVTALGDVHERGFGLRSTESCPSGSGDCLVMSNSELVDEWHALALHDRFMMHEPVDEELAERIGSAGVEALTNTRLRFEGDASLRHEAEALDYVAGKHIYKTSGVFSLLGWITFVCIAIAVVSLLISCAIVLAGKRIRLPVMPTTTALLGVGIAMITGCVFVAVKPGPPGYVGVGVGFFVFGAGVVLGLWSSLQLNKLMRPHDQDLLEDAMNPDDFEQ